MELPGPAPRSAPRLLGANRGPGSQDGEEAGNTALGLQNRIYICLRCPRHPNGFWTHSSQQYFEAVRGSGSDFAERSVSHAFASRAETEAEEFGALSATRQQPERAALLLTKWSIRGPANLL